MMMTMKMMMKDGDDEDGDDHDDDAADDGDDCVFWIWSSWGTCLARCNHC